MILNESKNLTNQKIPINGKPKGKFQIVNTHSPKDPQRDGPWQDSKENSKISKNY